MGAKGRSNRIPGASTHRHKNIKLRDAMREKYGSQIAFARVFGTFGTKVSQVIYYDGTVSWSEGEKQRWCDALGLELEDLEEPKSKGRMCQNHPNRPVGKGLYFKCDQCHNQDNKDNVGCMDELPLMIKLRH